jgi:Domain of unknown function (DUF4279)
MLADDAKWNQVSLRFFGEALPVDAIGEELGLEPTVIGRKGSHIGGNPRYATHKTNVWIHRFTTDSTVPIDIQLVSFVTQLEVVRVGLAGILAIRGVSGELFLGFGSGNGQGGFVVPSDLLTRIGALGLGVSIDLYPPDVDERTERKGG